MTVNNGENLASVRAKINSAIETASTVAGDISTLQGDVAAIRADVSVNKDGIATNAADIVTNAADIAAIEANLAARGDVIAKTAAQWASENTVLAVNEIGLETDTGRAKYGDGVTAWNSLPYRDTVFGERNAVNAAAAASLPDGVIVTMGGLQYEVDSAATGTASATNDLSVDGLVPFVDGALSLTAYGAKGDGVTDETAAVVAFFAAVKSLGCDWYVPAGVYNVNPATDIEIATSGVCRGTFRMPQSNTYRFNIVRDEAGTVLDVSGWGALDRGTRAGGATNAAGKNVYLASTEILMERVGNPSNPYRKQEMIRVNQDGHFTTPLVCTYNDNSTITATAHTPSRPITVTGLRVSRYGVSAAVTSSIACQRDGTILNYPEVVNENPGTSSLAQALIVSYCADVTVNNPRTNGTEVSGLGYGILCTGTIGVTINHAGAVDSRHGLSGAYNADLRVNGGHWEGIDDHWGNRMVIDGPTVYCPNGSSAVLYAGYDITVLNLTQHGGRNLLGIRTDSPHLGGKVVIRNYNIVSQPAEGTSFYVFGFSSASVNVSVFGTTFTNKPSLPDLVVIDGGQWDIGTGFTSATIAYLSNLQVAHTNWGKVVVTGEHVFKGRTDLNAVFLSKNAAHQEDRAAQIIVDGEINCGTGNIVYGFAQDSDKTRAADVFIGRAKGSLRMGAYSVQTLKAVGARIGTITNDDATETFTDQTWQFVGCDMLGGSITNTLRNLLFNGCTFRAAYTTFPFVSSVNYATLVGNVSLVAQAAMPADIRTNIVAPYNGV